MRRIDDVRPDVLVFDVNKTLLDFTALAPRLAAAFPGSDLLAEWFGLVDRLTLHAAHDRDVNGAFLAGAGAAFIERSGAPRSPHDWIPPKRRRLSPTPIPSSALDNRPIFTASQRTPAHSVSALMWVIDCARTFGVVGKSVWRDSRNVLA